MVGLIDTHSHIFLEEFSEDLSIILQNAENNGVQKILMPNIDIESILKVLNTKKQFPQQTEVMMGLHPCSVGADYDKVLAQIKPYFSSENCCAVGEIGLDFYWSQEFVEHQKKALEMQLQWAVDMNLPVSLHTRNATDETIAICQNFRGLRGVFHCFGGTVQQAEEIIKLGMYIGLGGVLTFKNSGLDKVVEPIALEHLVLETDAPYLAPQPHRGKRNEPSYLLKVAEKLAEIKNTSLDEVAEKTTKNALEIFNLKL